MKILNSKNLNFYSFGNFFLWLRLLPDQWPSNRVLSEIDVGVQKTRESDVEKWHLVKHMA